MARIDFHSNVGDKLEYVCRLVRKIWSATTEGESPRNIVVLGESVDLKKLDELLWTFSSTDFLPHCFIDDEGASETPIVLTDSFTAAISNDLLHADVFIHIGIRMPEHVEALLARFPRVLEVVTTDEAERLAGRERYKTYRDLGHELHNFDQSKS